MDSYSYPEIIHSIYDYLVPIRYLIPWYRYPLKRKRENIKPFFIIGSGRSGTTLLRRILVQADGVHIPPETYVLGRVIKLYRQNAGMSWNNLVNLVLSTIEYHHEFYTFNLSRLDKLSHNLERIPEAERSLAKILDSFYKHHAAINGIDCSIWGDKTPLNTLSIRRIDKLFPKAKYIYLTRDPFDVAYSYVKNGLYKDIVDAAVRWQLSNEKALSFMKKNPERVKKVKYEDIVSRPSIVGNQIFDFLSLSFDETFVKRINSKNFMMGDVEQKNHHYNIYEDINTKSIGKGRENLTQKEISKILSIIGNMKSRLEY